MAEEGAEEGAAAEPPLAPTRSPSQARLPTRAVLTAPQTLRCNRHSHFSGPAARRPVRSFVDTLRVDAVDRHAFHQYILVEGRSTRDSRQKARRTFSPYLGASWRKNGKQAQAHVDYAISTAPKAHHRPGRTRLHALASRRQENSRDHPTLDRRQRRLPLFPR